MTQHIPEYVENDSLMAFTIDHIEFHEVAKLVARMSSLKACGVDGIPAWLLKASG